MLKPRTKEEAKALEGVLQAIRTEWGFARNFDLPELVRRWKSFVGEVENGYQSSIHDYTQDLAMRDLLQQVKEQVPTRLAEEIESEIATWDARYQKATQPADRPIDEPVGEPAGEWWFRVPIRGGMEIMRHLTLETHRRR